MSNCIHPDGCPRVATTQGWCAMHYLRIRRNGKPGPVGSRKYMDPENERSSRRLDTATNFLAALAALAPNAVDRPREVNLAAKWRRGEVEFTAPAIKGRRAARPLVVAASTVQAWMRRGWINGGEFVAGEFRRMSIPAAAIREAREGTKTA